MSPELLLHQGLHSLDLSLSGEGLYRVPHTHVEREVGLLKGLYGSTLHFSAVSVWKNNGDSLLEFRTWWVNRCQWTRVQES